MPRKKLIAYDMICNETIQIGQKILYIPAGDSQEKWCKSLQNVSQATQLFHNLHKAQYNIHETDHGSH